MFGLEIPAEIEGVPSEILDPVNTVSFVFEIYNSYFAISLIYFVVDLALGVDVVGEQWKDKAAYNETLLKLAGLFNKNFEVFASYKIGKDNKLTEEILAAGPNF